uniref:Uncharacterized protein n=1 Tax=Aegilops tauschii subsp. strangulata TaxID=200361 RepID=A0A453BLD9_AEGTS
MDKETNRCAWKMTRLSVRGESVEGGSVGNKPRQRGGFTNLYTDTNSPLIVKDIVKIIYCCNAESPLVPLQ